MDHPNLLEGTPPVSRRRLQRAEIRAFFLAALGSLGTVITVIGPNRLDTLGIGAPIVGILVIMIALMALFLERWPDRLVRLVLSVGSVALICLGISWFGQAGLHRVAIGCFGPAVLFGVAAIDLMLSRRTRMGGH